MRFMPVMNNESPTQESSSRPWPIIRSLSAYRLADVPPDLIAGLTLAAIAVPEQMATARLAGLPPEAGFFAFIAGSLGFALLGDNRFLSCGADSTIAPIFAGGLAIIVAASTSPTEYAALAALLALMVGVLVCAGGLFRLGWAANLLSVPVTTGFLAGIGLHIIVSQLPSLLGIPHPNGTLVAETLAIFAHIGDLSPPALAIGAGVFGLVTLSDRIDAKIPGALIGLGLATVAVLIFHLEAHGVEVIGKVPAHWPGIVLFPTALDHILSLIPLALLIALVVMIQTAAVTRAFPSQTRPDVARDYVGVGAGSLLAGLIGAFPVDASPPRTEIVQQSGGRSQLAGLTAAALVLALLMIGARLLAHVPEAALSGVLLFIAFRIIRLRLMAKIYRESLGEFALVVATWAAIVLMPIEVGVAIGIGLSLLHGIWSITRAHAIPMERIPGTTIWWPLGPDGGETLPNVMVAAFQAPLSFLNADAFRRDMAALLDNAGTPIRIFVLEASAILEIDFTAAQVLSGLIRHCREQNIIFAIARLESLRAQEALRRFGIDKLLGAGRLFQSVAEAIDALQAAPK